MVLNFVYPIFLKQSSQVQHKKMILTFLPYRQLIFSAIQVRFDFLQIYPIHVRMDRVSQLGFEILQFFSKICIFLPTFENTPCFSIRSGSSKQIILVYTLAE